MKKLIGSMLFAVLLFTAASTQAAFNSVKKISFTISNVTVPSNQTFDAVSTKIVGGTPESSNAIVFSTVNVSGSYLGAPQDYIDITADNNNAIPWLMQVYSDNFSNPVVVPSTSTYGFSYGGLIGDATAYGTKVSMCWKASTTTVSGMLPMVLTPGTTTGVTPNVYSDWTFLKDRADIDDPAIQPPPSAATSSSWQNAQVAGYANIAFGNAGGTTVVTTNPTTGKFAGRDLASRKTHFNLFFRADFSTAPGDTYKGNIVIEMYNK
jgi:hypothetical protein